MKTNVPVAANGLADECPKCGSDELCIDNVEGLECMKCGCWFDTTPEGQILWARTMRPMEML